MLPDLLPTTDLGGLQLGAGLGDGAGGADGAEERVPRAHVVLAEDERLAGALGELAAVAGVGLAVGGRLAEERPAHAAEVGQIGRTVDEDEVLRRAGPLVRLHGVSDGVGVVVARVADGAVGARTG